jgi:UDP-glucose 4-epimerase
MTHDFLITGGAGFIGSHLVEALLDRGERVVVLDDLSTGRAANLRKVAAHPNLELVVGSVLDELKVDIRDSAIFVNFRKYRLGVEEKVET